MFILLVALFYIPLAFCKTHTFNWNISYVTANPDGLHERRMIGINNEWPNPTIRVRANDQVIINLTNSLPDRNTSLHFHGLFQRGYNAQDGPESVTQCPIGPGVTFTYDFEVGDQTGTFWYHSHSGSQYGDGLRGLFIIEDEEYPFEFDEEVTLSVGDHYHLESPQIVKKFMSRFNPTGAEPIPQNGLFNETKNVTWVVKPDTTYLLRVVNMGLFVSHYVYIEDHTLTIVEVDGVKVEPVEVDSLYLTTAQRYVVLVKTKATTDKNFRFVNVLDQDMLDFLPLDLQVVSTNWVVYNDKAELPKHLPYHEFEKTIEPLKGFNDFDFRPLGDIKLYDDPDYTIQVNLSMDVLGDGVTYATFNGISFTAPKVPTLYTVLSSDDNVTTNELIYGTNTNSFVLQGDEVVEIILNNLDPGKHPFHMHGHIFQLISRFNSEDEDNPLFFDPENPEYTKYPEYPMMRDTVEVQPNGFIVLRFRANNPGVWFFHCHVDWHLEQGLALLLVENPLEIKSQQGRIPKNHIDACKAIGTPYQGNAAGNAQFLDLHGENLQPVPLPAGFTTKGYIAMALCTILALYGLRSIYNYGMEDVSKDNSDAVIQKLYKILDEHQ
ncbi:Iron transport multicopper oxidase FET3 [Candida viswanathii]|uniref:Iron transport multicopper oxidase FET3 n=1 Tax=Candida viswanathii TaxID=5486 RepID=A0A367YHK8_9ASCO|nr:Iron transport multicopper oxidase FET3 [Candida viswanathii]